MFQELAAALLMQIASAFPQYSVPNDAPPIHLMEDADLKRTCGDGYSACIGKTRSGHVHIFLPAEKSRSDYEVLLGHELVHYVQWHNGRQHRLHTYGNLEKALEREAGHFEIIIRELANGGGILPGEETRLPG